MDRDELAQKIEFVTASIGRARAERNFGIVEQLEEELKEVKEDEL